MIFPEKKAKPDFTGLAVATVVLIALAVAVAGAALSFKTCHDRMTDRHFDWTSLADS